MMKTLNKFKIPLIIAGVFILLAIWYPTTFEKSLDVVKNYSTEILLIMPPVFILMGLIEVWIPKEKIKKLLGKKSGIKGVTLSFFLGTLPTGPLYAAFPLASSLLNKGARMSNIVIFLGSWAALKIPQLLVEMKFLGLNFTVLRFVLTFISIVIIGLFMEYIFQRKPKTEEVP
ncbi:MAG: permease [Kosmotogaceae bacterium]